MFKGVLLLALESASAVARRRARERRKRRAAGANRLLGERILPALKVEGTWKIKFSLISPQELFEKY